MKHVTSGGGWPAIIYVWRKAREVGGVAPLWRALRSRNACKTCALGMGGQRGGMVNERGSFPEVCTADMQAGIPQDFWSMYSIDHLRQLTPHQLETSGRLTTPVLREHPHRHYVPITWADAMTRIAEKLRQTSPDETFWYFSGRSSNEAGFVLQLFARLFGTNHVNNCSYYCHQASGVGLTSSVGTSTATIELEDVERADLVFLIGGNPASNHPRLMTTLKNIRRRGGHVIVINPVRETGLIRFRIPSDPWSLLFGTSIASRYIQPHIGGDLALLLGIAQRVVKVQAHDGEFLSTHCEGSDAWLAHLRQLDPEALSASSGVGPEDIDAVARLYAASKATVFAWTMGITHHLHGVENVQAIANLALLRGMVGKPHAGLMPIRGHSNVQGIGSVGVTPQLKQTIFDRLEAHFGVKLPTQPGFDTMGCMEAAHARHMKVGVCLGGNLYGSNPDSPFVAESLSSTDLRVYLSTTLNTGHAHGTGRDTMILPVLARDEEPQPTTQESMFNFVRFSEGGPRRHEGPRSEVEVIADLAHRVLGANGPIDWPALQQTQAIRQILARVIPGWEAIGEIDATRREFYISNRILHRPTFPTPTGKARLICHSPPVDSLPSGQLRLMTVRSEGQFNTVVYETEDLYRGQERRDIILIHPDDLQRLGLRHEQRVTVSSTTGSMSHILARAYPAIRPGNALMYYPEANVLVPRHVDPLSKTPAFKRIPITVRAD